MSQPGGAPHREEVTKTCSLITVTLSRPLASQGCRGFRSPRLAAARKGGVWPTLVAKGSLS